MSLKHTILPLLLLLVGCGPGKQTGDSANPEAMDVAALLQKNRELSAQVDALRGFSNDREVYLVFPARIEIGRYTRIEDDRLIVYLNLFDKEGEKIKAYGAIRLTLQDLTDPENPREIKRWEYDLAASHDHWLGSPLTSHFRFMLDLPKQYPRAMCVIARFTDVLTGKTITAQDKL